MREPTRARETPAASGAGRGLRRVEGGAISRRSLALRERNQAVAEVGQAGRPQEGTDSLTPHLLSSVLLAEPSWKTEGMGSLPGPAAGAQSGRRYLRDQAPPNMVA